MHDVTQCMLVVSAWHHLYLSLLMIEKCSSHGKHVPMKHLSLCVTRHDMKAVAHCGGNNGETSHHVTEQVMSLSVTPTASFESHYGDSTSSKCVIRLTICKHTGHMRAQIVSPKQDVRSH